MVTSTPNKIVDFEANDATDSTAQSLRDKGRDVLEKGKDYVDATVAAAQDNPWKAAAIGAGVVAAVAATAYGASKLVQSAGKDEAEPAIDPDAVPEAINAGT